RPLRWRPFHRDHRRHRGHRLHRGRASCRPVPRPRRTQPGAVRTLVGSRSRVPNSAVVVLPHVSARAQPGRSRATSLFEATPGVRLEYVVTGSGPPTTVFAHGLAGSIAETRPLGSGVHGSRVFFHFRGHGRSAPSLSAWSYTALAAELRGIADHVG